MYYNSASAFLTYTAGWQRAVIPWAINISNHFWFFFCNDILQFAEETDWNTFTKTKAQFISERLLAELITLKALK